MTDALSGEKCVAISVVKPLLSHVLDKVLVAEDDDTDLMKEMKERMKGDLESSDEDPKFSLLLELCSFLDELCEQ